MNSANKPSWFITGTDTDVGKTFVACALLHALRNSGLNAIGMKPVAAGTDANGKNDDVEALRSASSSLMPYALINPYLFKPAVAPHIAAAEEQRTIDIAHIVAAFNTLRQTSDSVLVEGVGGFCVPLGPHTDTADLAQSLSLPVILVVGLRLGCINHALLTQQAIAARGLTLAGWIANGIDPHMLCVEENLATLKAWIPAPLLGIIPANSTPQKAAELIRIPG